MVTESVLSRTILLLEESVPEISDLFAQVKPDKSLKKERNDPKRIEQLNALEKEVLNRKDLAYKILGLPLFAKLCNTFQSIKDFRNDINHAGFRKKTKPRDSDKFKNKLVEVFNEIKFLLEFRSI